MAEALCRHRLAQRLGCAADQLEDRGVMVMSAGVTATPGSAASCEGVQIMAQRDLDISHHEAQPLTARLIKYADLILTMTHTHRMAIVGQWPEASDRTELLSPAGDEIADPVGGPAEMYRRCADQIDAALGERIGRLPLEEVIAGNFGVSPSSPIQERRT
jgi:protein-tyrosine phosphatase